MLVYIYACVYVCGSLEIKPRANTSPSYVSALPSSLSSGLYVFCVLKQGLTMLSDLELKTLLNEVVTAGLFHHTPVH